MKHDYLERILKARVYDVAVESPLELAPALSRRLGNRLLLKREDLQPVFSFKLRGAYNKMANLPAAALKRGVICASAGNHAQGVAYAAQKLGCRAVIVMPVTTPKIKVDAVMARGAEAVLRGDSYSDAYRHAMRMKRRLGLTFVHPYDDPDVIAGQGTIGMEILRQHPEPITAIYVAVGGGGVISGIASFVKRVRPDIRGHGAGLLRPHRPAFIRDRRAAVMVAVATRDAPVEVPTTPAAVSYNGALNQATLAPVSALAPGVSYSLAVNGAKNPSGVAVTPATFAYATLPLTLDPHDGATSIATIMRMANKRYRLCFISALLDVAWVKAIGSIHSRGGR